MTTSTKDRRESFPNAARDRIRYRAGNALGACGPTGRLLARTLGAHESDISRRKNGVAGHGMGPEARFYAQLQKLQKNDKTTPYPLIIDALAMVAEALEDVPSENLVKRFWLLVRHEAEREATENVETATFAEHGNLGAIADSMQEEAAVGVELAAVCRELARRGIDPRVTS